MDRATTLDPNVAARYLHGELSTKEAISFENEYLGAPAFRRHLEENGLLERYLQRDLSDAELEAVEKALLGDPELLDEIDRLAAIEEGLADLTAADDHVRRSAKPRLMSMLWSPRYSAAASIAAAGLLVLSGYLLIDNQNLRSEIDSFVNAGVTRTVFLMTRRGNEPTYSFSPPASGELTVLQIDATHVSDDGTFVVFDSYRATVTRSNDGVQTPIFEHDGLPLNGDDTVAVAIADRLLSVGDYEVELEGRMSEWAADRDFEAIARITFEITDAQ